MILDRQMDRCVPKLDRLETDMQVDRAQCTFPEPPQNAATLNPKPQTLNPKPTP